MKSFLPERLKGVTVPAGTAWLMGACMEARGKQELWRQRKPEVLDALREQAIIQSAESSNRIEGVTVESGRLKPILLEGARPRDRSEEELVGYRKALDWVHTAFADIPVEPRTILRLHELAQGGFSAGDAGQWKERNNQIIEILPNGERKVRFVPVGAKDVPGAIEQLCLSYRDVLQQDSLPPLLAAGAFVFDFLCIHPFRDGNGRVSRLLTLLLLYQLGYEVGRYLSLERIIEQEEETYYEVLAASSAGWHEAEHDLLPWWNSFLSVLRQAYRDLEQRLDIVDSGVGKSELVRQAVLKRVGAFTLREVSEECPSASGGLVRKVLSEMKKEGLVILTGRGRGARWRRRS